MYSSTDLSPKLAMPGGTYAAPLADLGSGGLVPFRGNSVFVRTATGKAEVWIRNPVREQRFRNGFGALTASTCGAKKILPGFFGQVQGDGVCHEFRLANSRTDAAFPNWSTMKL